MTDPFSFGARIRALRLGRKITQEDVSAATGISRSHIGMIETGRDVPSREAMVSLSRFFGVSLDYLENGQPAPGTPRPGQFVDDPDELALLEFWRGLDDQERLLMLKMLRRPG